MVKQLRATMAHEFGAIYALYSQMNSELKELAHNLPFAIRLAACLAGCGFLFTVHDNSSFEIAAVFSGAGRIGLGWRERP